MNAGAADQWSTLTWLLQVLHGPSICFPLGVLANRDGYANNNNDKSGPTGSLVVEQQNTTRTQKEPTHALSKKQHLRRNGIETKYG